jgi:hypothetical protein
MLHLSHQTDRFILHFPNILFEIFNMQIVLFDVLIRPIHQFFGCSEQRYYFVDNRQQAQEKQNYIDGVDEQQLFDAFQHRENAQLNDGLDCRDLVWC